MYTSVGSTNLGPGTASHFTTDRQTPTASEIHKLQIQMNERELARLVVFRLCRTVYSLLF